MLVPAQGFGSLVLGLFLVDSQLFFPEVEKNLLTLKTKIGEALLRSQLRKLELAGGALPVVAKTQLSSR